MAATSAIRHDRAWCMRSGSGTGGHVGGEDVVGVAVEVLASPVVAHRGARVSLAGGDLDVAHTVISEAWRLKLPASPSPAGR